jgi:hypothetical protein
VAEVASRRSFVSRIAREAGVAAAVLPLIDGEPPAMARGDETDLAIIAASVMLEHHAIALYDHGLKRGLFPLGLRDYATEFRGDHQGHRDTQVAIAEERGGKGPEPLAHYDFERTGAGDAFVREALEIEIAAQRAYTGLISRIRTNDYLLSAAFILVDEVRHMTVWQRVLGIRIY